MNLKNNKHTKASENFSRSVFGPSTKGEIKSLVPLVKYLMVKYDKSYCIHKFNHKFVYSTMGIITFPFSKYMSVVLAIGIDIFSLVILSTILDLIHDMNVESSRMKQKKEGTAGN